MKDTYDSRDDVGKHGSMYQKSLYLGPHLLFVGDLETERSSGGYVLSWLDATFDHLTAKDVLVLYHDSVANKTKRDFKL